MQLGFHNQTVVLLFAKYPVAGNVMTRLCPPLLPEDAVQVQRACMQHIWSELTTGDWCCPVLVGTPDDSIEGFASILDPATCDDSINVYWPQGEGDLGERLERASKIAFDNGAKEVVFLGVDSPMQNWDSLRQLTVRLENVDVAVGPCVDGGYYFLATRRHIPQLFSGIDWGTSRVLDQTRAIAEQLGLSIWQAELGYDIDRIDDLKRALGDIDPNCELARTIEDVLVKTDNALEEEKA